VFRQYGTKQLRDLVHNVERPITVSNVVETA